MKQNKSLVFLQEKGFPQFHVNKGFQETFFFGENKIFLIHVCRCHILAKPRSLVYKCHKQLLAVAL